MAVRKPPQNIPIQRVGERIFVEVGHVPSTSSEERQPASSRGVEVAPVMTPMPAL